MLKLQALSLQTLINENNINDINIYNKLEIDKMLYNIISCKTPIELFDICDNIQVFSEDVINILINKCRENLLYILLQKIKNITLSNRMTMLKKCSSKSIYNFFYHLVNHTHILPIKDEIVFALNNVKLTDLTPLYTCILEAFEKKDNNHKLTKEIYLDIMKIYLRREIRIIDYILFSSILDIMNKDDLLNILEFVNMYNIITIFEYLYFNNLSSKEFNIICLQKCFESDILSLFNLLDYPSEEEINICVNRCQNNDAFCLFLKINHITKYQADILINKVKENNPHLNNLTINNFNDSDLDFEHSGIIKDLFLFVNIDDSTNKDLLIRTNKEIFLKMLYLYNIYHNLEIKEIMNLISQVNQTLIPEIYYFFTNPTKNQILEMIHNINKNHIFNNYVIKINFDNVIKFKKYINNSTHLTKNEISEIYKILWNLYIKFYGIYISKTFKHIDFI
jgi:hypothetical protein